MEGVVGVHAGSPTEKHEVESKHDVLVIRSMVGIDLFQRFGAQRRKKPPQSTD